MRSAQRNRDGCGFPSDGSPRLVTLSASERNRLLAELDDVVYCCTDFHLLRLADDALARLSDAVSVVLALRRPFPEDGDVTVPVPRRATGRVLDRLEGWAADGLEMWRETSRSTPADFGPPYEPMDAAAWGDYLAEQRRLADEDLELLGTCRRVRRALAAEAPSSGGCKVGGRFEL